MELLGIDFGASRLRVAGDNNGIVDVSKHRYSSARLPFVIEAGPPLRITALKRLLDFDTAFPMPPSGISSMTLLADIFTATLSDCCPNGWVDQYAVVAVPPCVSQRQRSALRSVVTDLGLTRVRLVDDTLAALFASWEQVRTYKRILVYSWGAGMFSAGMYNVKGNSFHLVSQEGDRKLGGDDFDSLLAAELIAELHKLGGDYAPSSTDDFIRIVTAAEERKRLSGSGDMIAVSIGDLLAGENRGTEDVKISTESLFRAIKRSTEFTIGLARKVASSGTSESKPDAILAVGGMTLSPIVQEALQRSFGVPVMWAPEQSVAIGSVIFGQRLPGSEWTAERSASGGRRSAVLSGLAQAESTAENQTASRDIARKEPDRWSQNFIPSIDRAQAKYENGRLADAISEFDQVMEGLSKFRGDLYGKAAAALNAEGRGAEALVLLREGNRQDPRNRFIAMDLAQTCYKEALHARSVQKPQITVELAGEGVSSLRPLPLSEAGNSSMLAALLHLQGIGYWDQGRLAQALPMIAESVTIDPKQEGYKKNFDLVRDMLKNVRPNDSCPCRSGLKFKKCCGQTR